MRLRQRVRVNVCRPDGAEETVLKTARATLRSRLLKRFVGDRYAVLVLTPVGRHVEQEERGSPTPSRTRRSAVLRFTALRSTPGRASRFVRFRCGRLRCLQGSAAK